MDGKAYLASTLEEFHKLRDLAERAIAQVSTEQLFHVPGPECNSIAVIMKHIGGNLRSRWSNALTTDGEKPDRNRDAEFEREERDTAQSIRARWDQGWDTVLATFARLKPEQVEATMTIRGEPFTLLQATHRSLTHTSQHVGQIVYLAKLVAGPGWKTLSIPRGQSAAFNQAPTPYHRKG